MADDFSDITLDGGSSGGKSSGSSKSTGSGGGKKSASNPSQAVTGNVLRVILVAESWTVPGTFDRLDCGSFEIDSVEFSDPPPIVVIGATAVPLTKSIRSQPKSKAWEKVKMSEMAKQIASDAGMELMYDADDDPLLDRADQRQTSDLAFLQRVCGEEGLTLKVTDNKIVIFQEQKYEQKAAGITFTRGDQNIISASFSQDSSQTVAKATVRYKDPKSGKLVEVSFEPTTAPATSREAIINTRPRDLSGDAMREE